MNGLFAEKQAFISVSEGHKKRNLDENSENPYYVARPSRTPNLVLASDINKIVNFIDNWEESPRVCVDFGFEITNK